MIIYILSGLLILAGASLFLLELVFSIQLFQHSGGAGFGITFVGVFLLSHKTSKEKLNIRKKDLGGFSSGGSFWK